VPFAILDDPSVAAYEVQPLLGQHIALTVTPDSVSIAPATSEQLAAAAAGGKARAAAGGASKQQAAGDEATAAGPAGAVSKVSSVRMLPLLDCMPTLAGAKASSCARLEQVGGVRTGDAGFGCGCPMCCLLVACQLAAVRLHADAGWRQGGIMCQTRAGERSLLFLPPHPCSSPLCIHSHTSLGRVQGRM
jgi:hypothetical protein